MFVGERELNIGELAELTPGPDLGLALERVDRDSLSGHDRVLLMKARSRQLAHLNAQLLADIEAVWQSESELFQRETAHLQREGLVASSEAEDAASAEIRTALVLTRRAADVMLGVCYLLRVRLPGVWRALDEGRIDLHRARVIADQTGHLDEELARRVADVILELAPGLTTGQLRARLQRLVISIDPASAKDRYEQGMAERRVVCDPNDDGTANLSGYSLPAGEANAALRRIHRLAKAAKTKGDPRNIDQVKADIYLALLCGTHLSRTGSGDGGVVNLSVGLTTLAGLDENPGVIPGWGPVIADVARQVVDRQVSSEWRVTATDENGQPVAVVTTRRRPTAAQKRIVEVWIPNCVFPTCRFDSVDCDLDHLIPWAQTQETSTQNLEPLCRHDHRLKDKGWKVRQVEPGVYRWTSPLGHVYTTRPEPP
jgi:hypothetical protein